jgi:hypothetical protein
LQIKFVEMAKVILALEKIEMAKVILALKVISNSGQRPVGQE